jgi:hypothetical protein
MRKREESSCTTGGNHRSLMVSPYSAKARRKRWFTYTVRRCPLVPYNRDSSQWKGKFFISGGRKPLRDALYMPALVAMRFNPDTQGKI